MQAMKVCNRQGGKIAASTDAAEKHKDTNTGV
jgi:hypothetical protein